MEYALRESRLEWQNRDQSRNDDYQRRDYREDRNYNRDRQSYLRGDSNRDREGQRDRKVTFEFPNTTPPREEDGYRYGSQAYRETRSRA